MAEERFPLYPPLFLAYPYDMMAVEEKILECVRALPPEEQEKVREFAESLRYRGDRRNPLKSLEGLWARYDFDLTDEDFAEARREMWGNFPKDS